MGLEPRDELDEVVEVEVDDEAPAHDTVEPALADAQGLGVDLPEADTLDQRIDEPFDDDER